MDGSVSIHHRNIHAMSLEMFKVKNGVSNQIMKEIFELRDNIHRPMYACLSDFKLPQVNTYTV